MILILRKYLLSIIAFLSYSIILLSINNNDITLINTRAEMYTSSYSPTSGNTTVDIPAIPATKIKFSMFNEPDLGIKFLYPSGWEPVIKRGSGNSTLIEILFPNMTSSSNSSSLGSGHWYGPATSFIVLSIVESDTSLSDSNVTALNLLTKQNLVLANQTLLNFQLIASNVTTFAGNPAHRIVYSFTEPSMLTPSAFQFQSMNIWTIKEDKTYTLSYSQPMEEYNTYLAVVQQMIDSFEITE
jgi:hypothetical protein